VARSDWVAASAARGPLGDPMGAAAGCQHWPADGALRGARRRGNS